MDHSDHRAASAQTSVSAPRRRGRPRDPGTDHKILVAAAALMLTRGFDRMTVDDVAAEAGVGKATVYRRWASKDDLAVAAMEQIYSRELPEVDTGSLVEDLTQSYRNVLIFVNSPDGAAFLRMSIAESIRDERIAALYRASTERAEANAAKMYERAIDRGEIRSDVDIPAVVQILGGILAYRSITNRPLPGVDEVDELVRMTLEGIRP